jgi:hypothetical protein
MPTTYLIDRPGRMVGRTVGPKACDSDTATELLVSLIHAPPQKAAHPGAGGKQR